MNNQDKLPTEFKAKWIEALRSGKYKQGKSVLYNKDNNTYCCLGVAGSVAGMNCDDLNAGTFFYMTHLKRDVKNLPKILYKFDKVPAILIRMNDRQDKSFNEIADYIEENL